MTQIRRIYADQIRADLSNPRRPWSIDAHLGANELSAREVEAHRSDHFQWDLLVWWWKGAVELRKVRRCELEV